MYLMFVWWLAEAITYLALPSFFVLHMSFIECGFLLLMFVCFLILTEVLNQKHWITDYLLFYFFFSLTNIVLCLAIILLIYCCPLYI
jgi:hypothetical protein